MQNVWKVILMIYFWLFYDQINCLRDMSFFPLTGKGPDGGEFRLWYVRRYVTGGFEGPEKVSLNISAKKCLDILSKSIPVSTRKSETFYLFIHRMAKNNNLMVQAPQMCVGRACLSLPMSLYLSYSCEIWVPAPKISCLSL